jgi:hypothetical protein
VIKLLSLLAGWKGYAAAGFVSALMAAGGTYYVTSLGYRLAIATMQREQADAAAKSALASLVQFESDTGRIHAAAERFSVVQDTLGQKFDVISKEFQSAFKTHPLPADCVPDTERLRQLTQAVAAANAAAGVEPGPALPANP